MKVIKTKSNKRNFNDKKTADLYNLQNWVNQLGAMQITKPNLMMWVNSIPIGPIQEMPHTPLLMYGDLAIDNAIIDIMNQKNVDGGVTTLFNRCRRKNFGQKRRYKFCEERYEEVKVEGLPIRLQYSIYNPRYDKDGDKKEN